MSVVQLSILILLLCIVLLLLLNWLFEREKLPEEIADAIKQEGAIVCTFRSNFYMFMTGIVYGIAAFVGYVIVKLIEKMPTIPELLIITIFEIIWIGICITFTLYMKNWILVYYPNGMVHRTVKGRVLRVKKNNIRCSDTNMFWSKYVGPIWKGGFTVYMAEQDIFVSSFCRNFRNLKKEMKVFEKSEKELHEHQKSRKK